MNIFILIEDKRKLAMKSQTESASLFNPEFSFEPHDSFSFDSSNSNEQKNLGNLSATKHNRIQNHKQQQQQQQQKDNDEEEDEFRQTSKELEFLTKKEGICCCCFFPQSICIK